MYIKNIYTYIEAVNTRSKGMETQNLIKDVLVINLEESVDELRFLLAQIHTLSIDMVNYPVMNKQYATLIRDATKSYYEGVKKG